MIKRVLALCAALVLLLLWGCSGKEYSNTVSCRELSEALGEIDSSEYSEYSAEYIALFLEDSALYNDFCILYSNKVEDINEVGFFHAPDSASAQELYEEIEEYLEERREDERAFIASYAPAELPKLDGAQAGRFGNYVVYAILDSQGREQLFEKTEQKLREG